MARQQEFNVTQRRAINTSEDPNKYSTPDGRRLRVFAEPLRMNVEAEVPSSVRLAQALAEVKPTMIDFLSDRQAKDNESLFRQGTAMAMAGEEPTADKAEWTQRGYKAYKGYLEGERMADELAKDWAEAPKELGTDFDAWYKQWWEQKSQGLPLDSEYFRNKFDSAFMRGLTAIKGKHIEQQAILQTEENESVIVGTIYNTIRELRQPADGSPLDFSIYDVEALQKDMKLNLGGITNQRLDELTYQTALMYAEKYDDPKVLETFFLKHSDGTPALSDKKLNDGKRWGEKIQSDMERIALQSAQKEDQQAKAEKAQLDKARFAVYSKFITDDNMTTDAINTLTKQMFEKGMFTSLSEASSEVNQLFNLKKKEETQTQQLNSLTLVSDITAGKPIDEKRIISDFKQELISSSGAKEAFSALRQRKEHLEKLANENANEAKKRTELYKDRSYTIGESIIKNAIVLPKLSSMPTEEETNKYQRALMAKAEALRIYASKALTTTDKSDFIELANEQVNRFNASLQTTGGVMTPPAGAENYK